MEETFLNQPVIQTLKGFQRLYLRERERERVRVVGRNNLNNFRPGSHNILVFKAGELLPGSQPAWRGTSSRKAISHNQLFKTGRSLFTAIITASLELFLPHQLCPVWDTLAASPTHRWWSARCWRKTATTRSPSCGGCRCVAPTRRSCWP